MDSRRSLVILGFLARALLALITLAGFASISIWLGRPETIDSLQERAKARYVNGYQQTFDAAKSALDAGDDDRGIALLEDLLLRLAEIRKRDRLAAIKRDALRRLIEAHLELEQTPDALRGFDDLVALDDRDLEARIGRAGLLLRMPARRTEGEEEIERLHRLAPAASIVAKEYLALAFRRGDLTAAVRALHTLHVASISRADLGLWHFYWDTGESFSSKQKWQGRADLSGGFQVRLHAAIEESGELLRFRVDLPHETQVVLEDISFSFRSGNKELQLSAGELDLRLRGMIESRKDVLATRLGSRRSYFLYRLPEALPLEGRTAVSFAAKLRPLIPTELNALLADDMMVEATLKDLGDAADVDVLRFVEDLLASAAAIEPPSA